MVLSCLILCGILSSCVTSNPSEPSSGLSITRFSPECWNSTTNSVLIEGVGFEGIDTTGIDIPDSVIAVLFDGKKSPRVRSFKSGSIQAYIPNSFISGHINVLYNNNTATSEKILYSCSDSSFLHMGDVVSVNVKVIGIPLLLHKSEFAFELGQPDVLREYDVDSVIDYSFSCSFARDSTTLFISNRTMGKDSLTIEYGDYLSNGAYRAITTYLIDSSSNTLKQFAFFRGSYQRYIGSTWERSDTDQITLKELPIVYRGADSIFASLDISTQPDLLQDFLYSRFDGHSTKSYAYYKKEELISLLKLQPNTRIEVSLKFQK